MDDTPTRRLQVLVVDDSEEDRRSVARVLRQGGYEVEMARNGEEALSMLERGLRPALILLDLEMPVMDGEEFHRQLLGQPLLSGIPVVIHSSRAFSGTAHGYVEKPCQNEALLRVVACCAKAYVSSSAHL